MKFSWRQYDREEQTKKSYFLPSKWNFNSFFILQLSDCFLFNSSVVKGRCGNGK